MTDRACELKFIYHPFPKLLPSSSNPTYLSNYKDLLISDSKYYSIVSLLSIFNLKILVQALNIYEIKMCETKDVNIEVNYLARLPIPCKLIYMAYLIIFGLIIN